MDQNPCVHPHKCAHSEVCTFLPWCNTRVHASIEQSSTHSQAMRRLVVAVGQCTLDDRSTIGPFLGRNFDYVSKCPWDSEFWLSPRNKEIALPIYALTTKCAFCSFSGTKEQTCPSHAHASIGRQSVVSWSLAHHFNPMNRSIQRVVDRFYRSFAHVDRSICLRVSQPRSVRRVVDRFDRSIAHLGRSICLGVG